MSEPLLQVRDAGFRYGERTIFNGLGFDVARGEVLCVLGPNGSGKSTLLRCVSGELALATGSVRVGGAEVRDLPASDRAKRIGFVFQQHLPSFPFPVIDVVAMGRAPHLGLFGSPSRHDELRADAGLARVGMQHLRDRPYTDISGGERQLVLLARALVQEPELILLDEPTAHLDLHNQVLALQAIGALAREGVTMVMTTHDPNHAFLFPGRVALMSAGRFVAVGPADEVVTGTSLAATYGIEVGVYVVPRKSGDGTITLCTPWSA